MSRKRSGRGGARFALMMRLLAATAFFIAGLGLIPLATSFDVTSLALWKQSLRSFWADFPSQLFVHRFRDLGFVMLLGGGIVGVVALLFLAMTGVRTFAARRSTAAINAVVQVGLVAGLVLVVNAFSFRHYLRYDWTGRTFSPSVQDINRFPYYDISLLQPSGRFPMQFTLPASIADNLQKLREPTTIVVYQRHKTFGQLGEKPDAYDYAAERKVVEKVQDLVEQFREFGPQFRVELLDVESQDYDSRLDHLTRDAPLLRAALDAAPDNSIFFHASREVGKKPDGKPDLRENVQRLSFSEFYQLDKTASLGKSIVVVLEKSRTNAATSRTAAEATGADLDRIKDKIKRITDPEAKSGPDYRVYVIEAGSPQFALELKLGKSDYSKLRSEGSADSDVDNEAVRATKELKSLIESTTDNRVLVYKDGQATSYPFREFAELGDTEARDAIRPRGNLVLIPQGTEVFARKVLAINERRPRIGVATIHEWLSTEGAEELTMAGLRKALVSQGFDVNDLVLRKFGDSGQDLEAAAYSLEESRFDRLEDELAEIDASLATIKALRLRSQTELARFKSASLEELGKLFRTQLGGRPFTEAMRKDVMDEISQQIGTLDFAYRQNSEARQQIDAERSQLAGKERIIEDRRNTDLKAKTAKMLAECDMLIIPRLTVKDITTGYRIPPRLYRFDDFQVAAIKEFLKAGKPVLACFGSQLEPLQQTRMPSMGRDNLEDLFAELGIKFGKQMVLFGADSKAFAERRSNIFATASSVEWPTVRFEPPNDAISGAFKSAIDKSGAVRLKPDPIGLSMRMVGQSIGSRQRLDLRLKHPRPVYFVPTGPGLVRTEPGFIFTDSDAWNEDQPFPTRDRTPRFEPPKNDDPAKGTPEEKRIGSFPIAIAVDVAIPKQWFDDKAIHAGAHVRVAAIGHGGLFHGAELSPARERLLVNTCNWLLHRDERLAHPAKEWEYPRLDISPRAEALWRWGMQLALPGTFAFLGVLVLTMRRYR